ncbi:lamin tail domain-containing protein [Candidatus Saccharibacteria bacterium]|nr:lamin tail domain-containing protein [Candidatus Saccharibacteria bacterium]
MRINEIAANAASNDQFIELYNSTTSPVNLDGCAIQTNHSSTTTALLPDIELMPDDYISVYIKDTNLTLTKTTSGSVYLLSSDLVTELDSITYSNVSAASFWSNFDDQWRQTYSITPNAQNIWTEHPECSEGYYRNLETGNCNKTTASTAALSDCGAGKYRSPDTNRCKSLEALATALTPCDSEQYRNPDTDRCRN